MVELVSAFVLDLFLGDPPYSWHPVRILGRWIERAEPWLRARFSARTAGFILAIFLPLATFVIIWFFPELAFQFHPVLKSILYVYFLYSVISIKDLDSEARRVYTALRNDKLEAARQNLSRIVGRDTENLSEEEVVRGTVETVAESFVDGVLSPLFYAALGGAPLAMAYKAINTLDSMVGRKTPHYKEFGRASAKLDEWANWFPARISWFLIGLGTFFINGRTQEAWRVAWDNALDRSLPNGAVPEAAFAGALGVELGGTNYYQGQKVEMPKLGYPMRALEKTDIRQAAHLMKMSSWAALAFALLLSELSVFIFH